MKLSLASEIVESAIRWNMSNTNGHDAENIVPYLVGGPGLGKTTIVKDICKDMGIDCSVLSLAQYDPGELGGWPVPSADGTTMQRMRPDWMPSEGKGVLFIDELVQGPVPCQNIAAQIVNERRVGPHYLPDGWVVVTAGNRTSDRAGANTMPTHLRDRLTFVPVEADLEDTIAYFSMVGVDTRIRSFLRFRPEFLHKFDRDVDSCPSPRSWQRASVIINLGMSPKASMQALMGQIGEPAAIDFMGYLENAKECPDPDMVIADPDKAPIPTSSAIRYALCASLSNRATDRNVSKIIAYLKRLPNRELAAFTIKDAWSRDPSLKKNAAVREWALHDGSKLVL